MKISELNHVALKVKDVEKSIAFYQQLGLKQITRPNFDFEGAWFGLGKQELHLIAGREREVVSEKKGSHFALGIYSVEEAQAYLQDREIPFLGPFDRPDGAVQLFLTDPDGYVFELCQSPR